MAEPLGTNREGRAPFTKALRESGALDVRRRARLEGPRFSGDVVCGRAGRESVRVRGLEVVHVGIDRVAVVRADFDDEGGQQPALRGLL